MRSKRRQPFVPAPNSSSDGVNDEEDEDVGNLSDSFSSCGDLAESTEVVDLVPELRAALDSSGDYCSVSSPGGSSTASGPTYVRPAGFEHHAQEVLAEQPTRGSSRRYVTEYMVHAHHVGVEAS